MAKVIGLSSVGCAYQHGYRVSGWGVIRLDNGQTVTVPEEQNGFDAMLKHAESLGHRVNWIRKRLDTWVKTGA